MQEQVTTSIHEMERKFEVFSGEALKKPLIEIYFKNNPISGKITKLDMVFKKNLYICRFNGLNIRNIGDKKATDISIYFYFSDKFRDMVMEFPENRVDYIYSPHGLKPSSLDQYPYLLRLKDSIVLNKLENWVFPVNAITLWHREAPKILNIKIIIFYGSQDPIETSFIFKKNK